MYINSIAYRITTMLCGSIIAKASNPESVDTSLVVVNRPTHAYIRFKNKNNDVRALSSSIVQNN